MKRKEIKAAQERDARISSLKTELQRLNSEVEVYRKFKERAKDLYQVEGNNQEADLNVILEQQQNTINDLRYKLKRTNEVHNSEVERLKNEIEDIKTKNAITIDKLRDEVVSASSQKMRENTTTNRYEASLGTEAELNSLKTSNRLLELENKKVSRALEREKRRADRAEEECKILRKQHSDVVTEQRVKDNQLFSLRNELFEVLSSSGEEKIEEGKVSISHNTEEKRNSDEEEVETYEDVLKAEMESMHESYNAQINELRLKFEEERESAKRLQREVEELRPKT